MSADFEYRFFDGLFVYKPWRLFPLVSSLLAAICLVLLIFLPESPKFLLITGRKAEALKILNNIYKVNNKNARKVIVTFH